MILHLKDWEKDNGLLIDIDRVSFVSKGRREIVIDGILVNHLPKEHIDAIYDACWWNASTIYNKNKKKIK